LDLEQDKSNPCFYLAMGKVLLTQIMEGKGKVQAIACHEGTEGE
jgi:hypothetical protein